MFCSKTFGIGRFMSFIATSSPVFLSSAKYVSPVPPAEAHHALLQCFRHQMCCQKKGKQEEEADSMGGVFTLAELVHEGIVVLKPQAGRLLLLRLLLLRCGAFGSVICFDRGGPTAPHALTALAM